MNLKPKICLVVTGRTINAFINNLKSAQKLADLVELRGGFVKNISAKHLVLIKRQLQSQAIFTCRGRLDLIKPADDFGFDFIDVELKSLRRHRLKLNRAKLIVSYHNFDRTPSLKNLQGLVIKMRSFNPEICKIATMIKSEHDLKTLWQLLLNKKSSEKLIVIGMGEKGKLSRVLFPLCGSYLTYASFNRSVSAPGQIEIKRLKLFYQQLVKSLYAR